LAVYQPESRLPTQHIFPSICIAETPSRKSEVEQILMVGSPETNGATKPSRQQIVATGTLFREFAFADGVHVSFFQGMRLTDYHLDTDINNRLFWSRGETGTIQLDQLSLPVSEANATFVHHGERTKIVKHQASNTEVVVVYWPPTFAFPPCRQIFTPSDHVFKTLLKLRDSIFEGNNESQVQLVADELTKHLSVACDLSPAIRLALDVLNSRLDDPFAPQRLPEYLSLSDSQIRRHFNQFVGVSPSQYHLRNRINLAHYLIQTSPLPLESIALKCGFSSYPTFSSQFKRELGFSPKTARIR
jgi:AraC-like DNA-binding protein